MPRPIKDVREDLSVFLVWALASLDEVKASAGPGVIKLAFILEKPDGSGKVACRFEAKSFLDDLTQLVNTEELLKSSTDMPEQS